MRYQRSLSRGGIISMKVEIKFSVRDLVGDMRNGAYELAEDSTVEALMDAAQAEVGMVLEDGVKNHFVFLVNNRPAAWDTVLQEGDFVRVLYKILGG